MPIVHQALIQTFIVLAVMIAFGRRVLAVLQLGRHLYKEVSCLL